jgi:cbb3-type cytochrome oxidase subunit 3
VAWGDVPTWLLVLVSLLALGAAVLAYRKQAQEVRDQAEQLRLQSEQLTDQKRVNDEQVRLMELQERELRAAQDERERQTTERREAQARQVAAWFEQRFRKSGEESDWGSFVRNASLLPVFEVRVFFHFVQELGSGRVDARGLSWYPIDRGGPVEPVRVIPPDQTRFVEIPEAIRNMVDRCDAQTYVVAIHFTDAAGVRWVRDGRGELLDVSIEGARARTEANRAAMDSG